MLERLRPMPKCVIAYPRMPILMKPQNGMSLAPRNVFINAAILAIGATMQLGTDRIDEGACQVATDLQIVPNTITNGLTGITYAGTNSVSGGHNTS